MLDICWHFNRSGGDEKLEICTQNEPSGEESQKSFLFFFPLQKLLLQAGDGEKLEKNKLILNGETEN